MFKTFADRIFYGTYDKVFKKNGKTKRQNRFLVLNSTPNQGYKKYSKKFTNKYRSK